MSGLSDRLTNVDKLKEQIKKLELVLEHERREKGALTAEMARLQAWTEKIVGPAFGGLHDVVHDLRGVVERLGSRMSEQLDQLNTQVGGVEGAVNNLTTVATNEIAQVRAELERLNNQNPNIDLSGPISRLATVEQTVNTAAQELSQLIADQPPPEPTSGGSRRG